MHENYSSWADYERNEIGIQSHSRCVFVKCDLTVQRSLLAAASISPRFLTSLGHRLISNLTIIVK
jgi:hypothetical protein